MRDSNVSDHVIGYHAGAYPGNTRATCIQHTSSIWSPSICLLLVLLLLFLIEVHFYFRLATGIAILLFARPPFMKATLIHVRHSRHPTRRVERSMTAPGCVALWDIYQWACSFLTSERGGATNPLKTNEQLIFLKISKQQIPPLFVTSTIAT